MANTQLAPHSLLFLLVITLALVAAADEQLSQRQENMAEVIRVFTSPEAAAAADAETARRAASFMKRELGPFGVVLNAIDRLPESSVADVRAKAEALDVAEALLVRHHKQLLFGSPKIKDACRERAEGSRR